MKCREAGLSLVIWHDRNVASWNKKKMFLPILFDTSLNPFFRRIGFRKTPTWRWVNIPGSALWGIFGRGVYTHGSQYLHDVIRLTKKITTTIANERISELKSRDAEKTGFQLEVFGGWMPSMSRNKGVTRLRDTLIIKTANVVSLEMNRWSQYCCCSVVISTSDARHTVYTL